MPNVIQTEQQYFTLYFVFLSEPSNLSTKFRQFYVNIFLSVTADPVPSFGKEQRTS